MAIGIAIIGSGIFVTEQHLPAVKACSNLALKAIYSRSLKSAETLHAGVDLYSDDSGSGKTYHDLLLRSDVDAVIIALPILSQPEYIEAALAAGKHVLSEKPIAGDVKRAQHLIAYYKSDKVKNKATWAVAENFRFLDSFIFARHEIEKLGRVLGFQHKSFGNVKLGSKYIETPWRKKPEYQGGFLLDGGVHNVAATRLLLGDAAKPTSISAFTTLLRQYLPPVDTLNAIWLTKSGISGTWAMSFGTSFTEGAEYSVACEKGTITVARGNVVVTLEGEKEGRATGFPDEGSGVHEEVKAWAQGIVEGKLDPKQSPEEALADLEILEKMLRSGEGSGKIQILELQL